MGLTLSEPATAKDTACCQNATFKVGSSCMQGWRVNMEDAHTHILSLPDDPGTAFFAVFDGHGGAKIAEYAGKHLHKYVTQRDEYRDGDIAEAMKQAYLEIDYIMQSVESLKEEQSGCTAVAILVKENTLYCANVGDSRAVACIKGMPEPLSLDHKPNNEDELSRITAAGGFVEYNRVNGNLALSRALGDYVFKRNEKKSPSEQMVTAYPDVKKRIYSDDWEFIVIACDGIWDVMTNIEVITYIRQNIADGLEPEEICENLMMKCLAPDCQMAGLGCDNMTVVIIVLLQGRTYEELSTKCATTYYPAENDLAQTTEKFYNEKDKFLNTFSSTSVENSTDNEHTENQAQCSKESGVESNHLNASPETESQPPINLEVADESSELASANVDGLGTDEPSLEAINHICKENESNETGDSHLSNDTTN